MKTIVILAVAWISLPVAAQNLDSAAYLKYYNDHALFWNGSSWGKYSQHGTLYPFKQMEEVVRFSPEASLSYNQFMKDRTAYALMLGVSGVLIVGSLIAKSPELKGGLAIGGIISATIALPIGKKAFYNLNRSIWIHNRDMMVQYPQSH